MTIIFVTLYSVCYGQDCAKKIKKTKQSDGVITFSSPNKYTFEFSKSFIPKGTFYYLTISARLEIEDLAIKNVTVFFEDGSIWERPNPDVTKYKVITNTGVLQYYEYIAILRIEEEDMIEFSSKKVKNFMLNDIPRTIWYTDMLPCFAKAILAAN